MTMQEHMAGKEGEEGGGPGRGRGAEASLRGYGDELGHSLAVLPGQPLQHLIHLPLHHQPSLLPSKKLRLWLYYVL